MVISRTRVVRAPHCLASMDKEMGRFFRRARAPGRTTRAPSALDVTGIKSRPARLPLLGTESRRHVAGVGGKAEFSTQPGKSSASIGTNQLVVFPVRGTTSTSVPGVDQRIMELRSVLKLRQSNPLTPYNVEAWTRHLSHFGLLSHYSDIPSGLAFGFDAGITPIKKTFTPPNASTIHEFADTFDTIVKKEFERGRYVGPFTRAQLEDIIGPFQSSPLSLVPKPGKPGRYRLIQNLSYPYDLPKNVPSINSAIESTIYPCTWGTFPAMCLLVWQLPPGSEGSVRDVAEAYRTVPLHASQWPGLVVRLREEDSFAADTCRCFGLSSSAGVYGHVADAGADLFQANGIGPLSKWVDDHVFIRILREYLAAYNKLRAQHRSRVRDNGGRQHERGCLRYYGDYYPDGRREEFVEDFAFPLRDLSNASDRSDHDGQFAYASQDIDRVSEALGIPWEGSKTTLFAPSFNFTGIVWSIATRTVALTPEKTEKYIRALEEWEQKATHDLHEMRSLYGKLLHTCLVLPHGRAYLTRKEAAIGAFRGRLFVPHAPP